MPLGPTGSTEPAGPWNASVLIPHRPTAVARKWCGNVDSFSGKLGDWNTADRLNWAIFYNFKLYCVTQTGRRMTLIWPLHYSQWLMSHAKTQARAELPRQSINGVRGFYSPIPNMGVLLRPLSGLPSLWAKWLCGYNHGRTYSPLETIPSLSSVTTALLPWLPGYCQRHTSG